MKTTKLNIGRNGRVMTLVMAFLAVSTLTIGQIKNTEGAWLQNLKGRIFHKAEANSLFHTVTFYEISGQTVAPAISRTIHTASVDVIYEEALMVESWMTTPFETNIEERITVESWMTAPFESAIEESVEVENWMTVPFESAIEESVEVEAWMTAPFESAIEEKLSVETWMTEPMAWLCQ